MKFSLEENPSILAKIYSYKSSVWHKAKDNQFHKEKYKHHENMNIMTEKEQEKKMDKNSPTKMSDMKMFRQTRKQLYFLSMKR